MEIKHVNRKRTSEEEEDNGKEPLENIDSWDWWTTKINFSEANEDLTWRRVQSEREGRSCCGQQSLDDYIHNHV